MAEEEYDEEETVWATTCGLRRVDEGGNRNEDWYYKRWPWARRYEE